MPGQRLAERVSLAHGLADLRDDATQQPMLRLIGEKCEGVKERHPSPQEIGELAAHVRQGLAGNASPQSGRDDGERGGRGFGKTERINPTAGKAGNRGAGVLRVNHPFHHLEGRVFGPIGIFRHECKVSIAWRRDCATE